jgi:chlorobactene glucosyltransferase
MLIYNYIIASILVLIFVNLLVNLTLFKNIKNYCLPPELSENPPLVSILVPARNEEKNIARCINSLLKQDYKNIEILVLDDNSTDSTSYIVRNTASKDLRVRLISGEPMKKGWLGKCWACHQLSRHARGSYFIFTDADTLHYRDTVTKSLAAMTANNLDGISVYPDQIAVTFHERMTVPIINFAIISLMPMILIKYTKGPFFSTGIGQFFMFKKEAYESMGGHESIKGEILEDVHLSKQIKKSGFKYMIFDGSKNIHCRMYHNFSEIINGFTKFVYSAFGNNGFMEFIGLSVFSAIFLFPFLLLPPGYLFLGWSGPLLILNISQILIILAIKVILALRSKNRVLDVFFMPVSVIYMLIFAINSYRRFKSKKGFYWKGRTYKIESDDSMELIEDYYNRS